MHTMSKLYQFINDFYPISRIPYRDINVALPNCLAVQLACSAREEKRHSFALMMKVSTGDFEIRFCGRFIGIQWPSLTEPWQFVL